MDKKERYLLSDFNWWCVNKTNQVVPFLYKDKKVINFLNNTPDFVSEYSNEKIEEIATKQCGQGKIISTSTFVMKLFNYKEKNLFGSTPEMYGWEYSKFNKKQIIKISKLFSKVVKREIRKHKVKDIQEVLNRDVCLSK